MGGFNPPVPQQDNNTEIRVAVLLSLLLQVLILVLGPIRKRSSSPVARFAIWSCYLLADWVADLALGLLLNNMGNIGGSSSQSQQAYGLKRGSSAAAVPASSSSPPIIFAFWTPFLLVHLGGQDSLTALSIQDNDLWRRSLIGLLFQLFSACVIFFCSLQGNPMIRATVLIFVVGIIKYGERIYSLYSGSVDAVLADIIRPDPDPGPNYAKLMTVFSGYQVAGLDTQLVISNPLREYDNMTQEDRRIREAQNRIREAQNRTLEAQAYRFICMFRPLCFDATPSYKERKISQEYFYAAPSPAIAFQVIELELNFMYDMVHTKEPIVHTKAGCALRFVGSTCIVSALLIFFFRHKGGITRVDVAITYALLLGGVALDAAALAMMVFSNWTLVFLEETPRLAWLARAVRSVRPRWRRWREDTLQLNLISYSMGVPLPRRRRRFCSGWRVVLDVRETFHDLLFIRRKPLSTSDVDGQSHILLNFVFDVLKKRGPMQKRSRYPGEGVLDELHEQIMENMINSMMSRRTEAEAAEEAKDYLELVLRLSLQRDESLMMWHIATDLCCYPLCHTALTEMGYKMRSISETLSEYMLYLLIKQPNILLASAGFGLKTFRDTCAEAKRFFESAAAWEPNHDDFRRMLLSVDTTKEPSAVKGDQSKSVLFDAVILAKVLRCLGNDLMWEVVAKVWGEMLTYAAGKCKGSTHVQQLSRGGELITMVWFLMAHMGLSDDVPYKINELYLEGEFVPKLIVRDH